MTSLIDRLNFIVRIPIFLGLLCRVALISLQVAMRFVLPKLGMPAGLPWTEEAARYLMVWVIFLGGAIAARHGLLIAVTVLIKALPTVPSRLLRRAALTLLAGIFAAMAWYGWQWTLFGADKISPALTLSKFWLYLSMPVGCALAAVNTLVLMVQNGETHEALAACPPSQAQQHRDKPPCFLCSAPRCSARRSAFPVFACLGIAAGLAMLQFGLDLLSAPPDHLRVARFLYPDGHSAAASRPLLIKFSSSAATPTVNGGSPATHSHPWTV